MIKVGSFNMFNYTTLLMPKDSSTSIYMFIRTT